MSLKRNTVANYIGQGYSALIGVVVMPLYLKFLGAEAFGLVGFLVLLQAWLRLLDLGLSPTLARQVAYARGLRQGFGQFARLLRSFESIFLGIAVTVAVGVFLASGWIAREWVQSEEIGVGLVSYCVTLMGVIVAVRLVASLYRSGIQGMEDQVWLNKANILIATARAFGALLLLRFVSTDIRLLFEYYAAIGLLETLVLAVHFYARLELKPRDVKLGIDRASVQKVLPFALSIAYASALWVALSQTDKLILSAVLPLQTFGYFTLISLMTGGILALAGPVTQAMLPRLTTLLADGRRDDMVLIYRRATQVVATVTISLALLMAAFPQAIVYAWTGDRPAAEWCNPVLPWFALGNGVLALSAFQFYLQNALGDLRLHVVGSTISALLQVPIILFAAIHYGAEGAGIAWFAIRLVWFLGWTAFVHGKLVPGLHGAWLARDLLPLLAAGVAAACVLKYAIAIDLSWSRLVIAAWLALVAAILAGVTASASSYIRSSVAEMVSDPGEDRRS